MFRKARSRKPIPIIIFLNLYTAAIKSYKFSSIVQFLHYLKIEAKAGGFYREATLPHNTAPPAGKDHCVMFEVICCLAAGIR